MTAQASDTFLFHGEEFSIAGVNGEGLFEPEAHGFTPVGTDTGCYRGYLCTYSLCEDRLVLAGLSINHGSIEGRSYVAKVLPPFNGYVPQRGFDEESWFDFDLRYTDLSFPVAFSGGLLIATDFIQELYVHMGYHPAWKFRRAHELIFKAGLLINRKDISQDLEIYREKFQNSALGPSGGPQSIAEWVEKTFTLKYES